VQHTKKQFYRDILKSYEVLFLTALLYYNKSRTNNFKSAPIFSDWKYKSEPGKAGLLTFKSPQSIGSGNHLKLINDNEGIFGGQLVKRTDKKGDFYSYEALDYKQYLLKEMSLDKKNITASAIVKLLSKEVPTLKWKIGNTSYKYAHPVFKDKSILTIINQLIWLEYEHAHNLILFNVDYNANLTFKSYPQTMKGYIFTSALDYTTSLDYSDIRTGYELIDNDTGKVISSYTNKTLQAIWGDIRIQEVYDDNGS
jgi:hypothetical protein